MEEHHLKKAKPREKQQWDARGAVPVATPPLHLPSPEDTGVVTARSSSPGAPKDST